MFQLHPGDKVGIITPANFLEDQTIADPSIHRTASVSNHEAFLLALEYLKNCGLVPVCGKNVFAKYRYMGGTPQQRADDIMTFFKDPEIKAIFSTTGGGGSQHLLPYLDYEAIRCNPKPVFGISDVSTLQLALYSRSGCPSYNGFNLTYDFRYGKIRPQADQDLSAIFNGNYHQIQGGETINPGIAEGIIVGGCLSMLRNLSGTEYFPDLSNKILAVEDIGERSYRIDLMLIQLAQNPQFKKLKGIIFGGFNDCVVRYAEDGTVDEIINYFCADLKIPAIKNFPWGHFEERNILPIGIPARLDAENCTLHF